MKFIIYDKKTLKVIRIMNKEPIALTDNLGLARCEIIPQGDNFSVSNIQTHTEQYIIKETKEVAKVDEEGNEYTETEYEEVVKTREYQTCKLVAKVYTEEQIALRKRKKYENLCKELIAKKYPYDKENKVQREYLEDLTNADRKAKFDEYNAYVKECLAKAEEIIYGGE